MPERIDQAEQFAKEHNAAFSEVSKAMKGL
jgi:hypothetical protein